MFTDKAVANNASHYRSTIFIFPAETGNS